MSDGLRKAVLLIDQRRNYIAVEVQFNGKLLMITTFLLMLKQAFTCRGYTCSAKKITDGCTKYYRPTCTVQKISDCRLYLLCISYAAGTYLNVESAVWCKSSEFLQTEQLEIAQCNCSLQALHKNCLFFAGFNFFIFIE